jgi:hypothetical protein
MTERRSRVGSDIVAAVLSAIGAVCLAGVSQQASLGFFYRVVPGAKSTDGPILVVLAYVLAIPASIIVYLVVRKRWIRVYGALAGSCIGPLLMIGASVACAWLARLPVRPS